MGILEIFVAVVEYRTQLIKLITKAFDLVMQKSYHLFQEKSEFTANTVTWSFQSGCRLH